MSIWRPAKRVDVEVPVARLFRVGEPQGTAWRSEPRPVPGDEYGVEPCSEVAADPEEGRDCDRSPDPPRVTPFDAAFRHGECPTARPEISITPTPDSQTTPETRTEGDSMGLSEEPASVTIPSAWPWAEPPAAVEEEPAMDVAARPYWEAAPTAPEPPPSPAPTPAPSSQTEVAPALAPMSVQDGGSEAVLVDDWKQTELVARLIVGLSEFRTLLGDVPDAALGQAVREAANRELGGVTRTLATLMAEDYRGVADAGPGMDRLEWLLGALADSGADGGRMEAVRPLLAEVRGRARPR